MTPPRCALRIGRRIPIPVLFTIFSVFCVSANAWDIQGAARSFQEGLQKRKEIAQSSQPTPGQYLDCAKTYRKVYLRDPHYGRAGDAIYEEALIYQEMGDRFADLESYRMAVKRFQFLITDYGRNSNCPDALLRMGNIYLNNLKNEAAAQDAYGRLETKYRKSDAFSRMDQAKASLNNVQPTTAIAAPQADEPPARAASSVQNIRFWSTSEYTRVLVDMDLDAQYQKGHLSNPYRIYFDISGAKLGADLKNRTFPVEDKLLKQIRIGQNRPDAVRVVLELSEANDFSTSELHDPFRIVIDLPHYARATSGGRPSPPESSSRPDEIQTVKENAEPNAGGVKMQSPGKTPIAGSAEPRAKSSSGEAASSDRVPENKTQPPPLAVTAIESAPPKEAIPNPAHPSEANIGNQPQDEARIANSGIKPRPAVNSDSTKVLKVAPFTSTGERTLTRMLGLKIGRVVIDPGHGGHDWGTIGPGGLLEKDLTLSLARGLQTLLEQKLGAEVLLTRTDDTFVSLEERTALANRHRADLFISIHGNSSRIHSTSGVETYYLDFARTDAEREIAARENATSVNNVRDLEDLIKKIAQADKSMESKELASIIQKKLYAGSRKMFPSTKNRGVRRAPFVVLIGANMPSVLAEVAFISNPKDERLLRKEANQERLVKALYSGIEDYIKTLGVDVAHNQTSPK